MARKNFWRSINQGKLFTYVATHESKSETCCNIRTSSYSWKKQANKLKSLCVRSAGSAGARSTTSFGVNKHIKFYWSIFFVLFSSCFHKNFLLVTQFSSWHWIRRQRQAKEPLWVSELNWILEKWISHLIKPADFVISLHLACWENGS